MGYLNDGVYDEKLRMKDLKTKKTRGGRRKRRNRGYILKSEIRHRRRHQNKKHRKNVHHFNKRKRIKSKMAKGYYPRSWIRSRKGPFYIIHQPAYSWRNNWW